MAASILETVVVARTVGCWITSATFSFNTRAIASILLSNSKPAAIRTSARYFTFLALFVLFLFNIVILFLSGKTLKLLYKFAIAVLGCFTPIRWYWYSFLSNPASMTCSSAINSWLIPISFFIHQANGFIQQAIQTISLAIMSIECHWRTCVCSWIKMSSSFSRRCGSGEMKIQPKKE